MEVWISNHRSVDGILDYVRRLGALVGVAARADAYADELQRGLDEIAAQSARLPRRPRVYFEEWDEPRISGIQWVAELVRIAGGDDIFPERAEKSLAPRPHPRRRHGRSSRARPTSCSVPGAARNSARTKSPRVPAGMRFRRCATAQLFEIKSPIILQPGPAALTDGVREIARHIQSWAGRA